MLTEPLIQQLHDLRLNGMAAALAHQTGDALELSFDERLGLLIQHELTDRASARLAQRLRWARLPQQAVLEDLDTRTPRGLDPHQLAQVRDLGWIDEHLNVLITGPCGVGKSFIACALAHAVCRADHSVRCFRLPRLIDELARCHALNNRASFLKRLAKVDLMVIDDFGLTPLTDAAQRDLLEILDDRYDKKSTLITSQLPVDAWHAYLGDPTLADAILDRLVHNSYRLALQGASMRKQKARKGTLTDAGNA
ncbi:MAG: IS21-like element helper ATPase IstB [Salinisphaera sp.]|nr:IS21-like element helper ATPase IstB [Salinisphaera sp.]